MFFNMSYKFLCKFTVIASLLLGAAMGYEMYHARKENQKFYAEQKQEKMIKVVNKNLRKKSLEGTVDSNY